MLVVYFFHTPGEFILQICTFEERRASERASGKRVLYPLTHQPPPPITPRTPRQRREPRGNVIMPSLAIITTAFTSTSTAAAVRHPRRWRASPLLFSAGARSQPTRASSSSSSSSSMHRVSTFSRGVRDGGGNKVVRDVVRSTSPKTSTRRGDAAVASSSAASGGSGSGGSSRRVEAAAAGEGGAVSPEPPQPGTGPAYPLAPQQLIMPLCERNKSLPHARHRFLCLTVCSARAHTSAKRLLRGATNDRVKRGYE